MGTGKEFHVFQIPRGDTIRQNLELAAIDIQEVTSMGECTEILVETEEDGGITIEGIIVAETGAGVRTGIKSSWQWSIAIPH